VGVTVSDENRSAASHDAVRPITPVCEARSSATAGVCDLSNIRSILWRMSGLAPDHLITPVVGSAARPAQSWRLTAGEEATAAAELRQAASAWVNLLAECAGLALGYGEQQFDAVRYRQITGLCIAAGVDETLIQAWIEVGRQRAATAAPLTHKACILGALPATSCRAAPIPPSPGAAAGPRSGRGSGWRGG